MHRTVTQKPLARLRLSSPGKVLVVDDDENIRRLIQLALGTAGFQVLAFGDAREALQSLSILRPDLIVSDLLMPEMDGWTFLQHVRRRPDFQEVPFLFLSAVRSEQALIQSREAGADDFLNKPFPIGALVSKVRTSISRSRRTPGPGLLRLMGDVDDAGTQPLLLFLEGNRMSGRLTVQHEGRRSWAEFRAGEIVALGGSDGAADSDHLKAILTLRGGSYVFDPEGASPESAAEAAPAEAQEPGEALEVDFPEDRPAPALQAAPAEARPDTRVAESPGGTATDAPAVETTATQELPAQEPPAREPASEGAAEETGLPPAASAEGPGAPAAPAPSPAETPAVEVGRPEPGAAPVSDSVSSPPATPPPPAAGVAAPPSATDGAVLADAVSLIAERAAALVDPLMTSQTLRRSLAAASKKAPVLRAFRVREDGRVTCASEPAGPPSAAVAGWVAAFLDDAALMNPRVKNLRARQVTQALEGRLESAGFYTALNALNVRV